MTMRLLPLILLSITTTVSNGYSVAVVGGSGFVGSRVVQILAEKGHSVTAVSKSGKPPAWFPSDADFASSVDWKALDLLTADDAALDAAIGPSKPDALVSCVGVVGTDAEELRSGNGEANVKAFAAGQRAGISKAVLVSVASEVASCKDDWLPDFLLPYFEGKEMAEAAANDAVGGAGATIVRPTFIYGGDSFGLLPPRVNADYGSGVEELLSSKPFRLLADATPGLVKVALRPPVSVDAVAGACAAAAVGDVEAGSVLDGTDAIKAAAGEGPSTGLTEAVSWAGEQLGRALQWAQTKASELSKAE